MQRLLGMLQLVIYHDVHHLLHITLNVVVTHAVLHGTQQTFNLIRCRIVDITVSYQHTRKVGDTFHGGHVKGTLEAHSLAQVG